MREFDGQGFTTWKRKAISYLTIKQAWLQISNPAKTIKQDETAEDAVNREVIVKAYLNNIIAERILDMFSQETAAEL